MTDARGLESWLPPPAMTARELDVARQTRGFMPHDEGLLLHRAGLATPTAGPMLEVGSYCGLSTVYLASAARRRSRTLFCVDHHRGSEENQPGELYFDPAVGDADGGVDTLPHLRRTLRRADLEASAIPVVGASRTVSQHWRTPLSLLFIDGGHTEVAAQDDYEGFSPHVEEGGLLVIHDVFSDPADGGQAPYHVYLRALDEGFEDAAARGSMRVLRRSRGGPR